MKRIVTNEKRIEQFVSEGIGGNADYSGTSIGLEKDGELVAGVVYTDFNGKSITASIHGKGVNWLNREFLWFIFFYPFKQLEVGRITVTIETFNKKSHNLAQKLGFTHEATLQKAGRFGDLHVYRMFREDCKWLKVSRYGTKSQRIAA